MTKIKIKNFQSIGKAEFDIDGFTVIVGKNNIGKSAVIRSIDAALSNQTGKSFIKKGEKSTDIEIHREGLEIHWKKGGTAVYTVNGKSYSKLNRAVPEPITKAGFRKIDINNLKINPLLAPQFKALFLLNESGTVITEILSEIYGLDVISRADDKCQLELRSRKRLIKLRETDLRLSKEKLEKYKDFENVKIQVLKLQEMEKACSTLRKKIQDIEIFEQNLCKLTNSVKKLEPVSKIKLPDTKSIESDISEFSWIHIKNSQMQKLSSAVEILKNNSKIPIPDYIGLEKDKTELIQVEQWSNSLKRNLLTQKAITQKLSRFDTMEDMAKVLEEKASEALWVIETEFQFRQQRERARSSRDELEHIKENLEKLQEEKSAYKICPTCGNPL